MNRSLLVVVGASVVSACFAIVALACVVINHVLNAPARIVECTVERVVDDETDMPAVDEQYERPYTIVSHQPRWSVFTVPGDLGEPGQRVKVVPPESE